MFFHQVVVLQRRYYLEKYWRKKALAISTSSLLEKGNRGNNTLCTHSWLENDDLMI